MPGHIVAIADPMKAQARTGGRLMHVDSDRRRVVLDSDFEPSNGEVYDLLYAKRDGTLETRRIESISEGGICAASNQENFVSYRDASVGQVGSGGTLPIGWNFVPSSSVTATVVEHDMDERNRPYVDIRFQSVDPLLSEETVYLHIGEQLEKLDRFENNDMTFGARITNLTGNSEEQIRSMSIALIEHTSGASTHTHEEAFDLNVIAPKSLSATGRITEDATNGVKGRLKFEFEPGQTVDFVVRVAGAQINIGEIANTQYVPVGSRLVKLQTALSEKPVEKAMWAITGTDVAPRTYRVLAAKENEDHHIEITALFHDPTKYDRVENDLILDPIPYTRFDREVLPPENVRFDDMRINREQEKQIRLMCSWSTPSHLMISHYRVEIKAPNGEVFRFPEVHGQSVEIVSSASGDFEASVIAVSIDGRASTPTLAYFNSAGWYDDSYPDDISNFQAQIVGDVVNLHWDRIKHFTDFKYVLKYSSREDADWTTATTLLDELRDNRVQVPARVGRYFIKAVSSNNIESRNSAIVAISALASSLNAVGHVEENAPYSGTLSGVVFDAGLNGLIIDEPNGHDVETDGPLVGYYYAPGHFDITETHTSRLVAEANVFGVDFNTDLFTRPDFFGIDDYFATKPGEWEVQVEVRTTKDNPNSSPTWSEWQRLSIADFTARAFEFRVKLTSYVNGKTPVLLGYSASIDMPDRVEAGDNIPVQAGGRRVVFSDPFKGLQGVTVTAQGMQTGDYHTITNKTTTGFDVEFFNKNGTSVARSIDFVAKGYGRVVPNDTGS